MNHQQPAGVSRRSMVKGGVCALTGIAITFLTRTGTSAAETKLAKSAVQYVDAGEEEGKDCDDCNQFIPGKNTQGHGNLHDSRGRDQPAWPLHSIHAQTKKIETDDRVWFGRCC